MIQTADVIGNERRCREHLCLTLRIAGFPVAHPGQFVLLSPRSATAPAYRDRKSAAWTLSDDWVAGCFDPLLPRAFSIAGLRRLAGTTGEQ